MPSLNHSQEIARLAYNDVLIATAIQEHLDFWSGPTLFSDAGDAPLSARHIAEKPGEELTVISKLELRELLALVLRTLDDNSLFILSSYYLHEKSVREISQISGMQESRISAILKSAIARMRVVLASIAPVVRHAIGVFGDKHKASHWLKTPLPLLDNHSPSQVLVTPGGVKKIEQILTRIEHNIPS